MWTQSYLLYARSFLENLQNIFDTQRTMPATTEEVSWSGE